MMKDYNEMNFEQAYEALNELVTKLEDPAIKLDESIELYEQACKLVVLCRRKLNDSKVKITDINERIAELEKNGESLTEE